MNVNVITTENFRREAKKLLKKYQSLKKELQELVNQLEKEPRLGTKIGEDTYKIRLAVKSKGKGKSGGMRVITYVDVELELKEEELTVVYLMSIYDKSDTSNISDKLLKQLVKEIQESVLEKQDEDKKSESKETDEDE